MLSEESTDIPVLCESLEDEINDSFSDKNPLDIINMASQVLKKSVKFVPVSEEGPAHERRYDLCFTYLFLLDVFYALSNFLVVLSCKQSWILSLSRECRATVKQVVVELLPFSCGRR